MAIRDEIRRERQAVMKNGTLKDKWQYFVDYYLKITLAIILVLVLMGSFIYSYITKPETVLSAIFLNVYSYDSDYTPETLAADFAKAQKIDTSEYEVAINSALAYSISDDSNENQYSNYETSQVIMTQAAAGALDAIAGPYKALHELAYSDLFVDLSTILTDEQMKEYEEYLLYMDKDVIVRRNELYDEMGDASSIEIPTSMDPDGMVDPIPVAIDMSHCSKLADVYAYNVGAVSFAVVTKAPNVETIQQFVDYLMK